MSGLTLKSDLTLVLIAARLFRAPTTLHSKFGIVLSLCVHFRLQCTRHRRIHEAHQDDQRSPVHDEDLENEDNETGSADENSSPQAIPSTMVNSNAMTSMPTMNMHSAMPPAMPAMMAPQMIAPQLLQQQI